jgi:hypothetical protein
MNPDLFAFSVSASAVASIGRQTATTPAKATRCKRVRFIVYDSEPVRAISPAGRYAWALQSHHRWCRRLHADEHVGPRWSGYVHKLRNVYGLNVETITEMHGGEFAGKHARYVLRSRVAFADPADASRHGGAQ